jgi:peptide chain release factor 2
MEAPDFWQNRERAQELIRELQELKNELAGGGKYAESHAIISLLAGAGGTDAEDFAALLFNMYQKYAQARGWGLALLHSNQNNHGGYRNVTFIVRGQGAYGILRGEAGVHRLVRISPFNAKKLRHTSFALVEVVPELKPEALVILPQDLKIEFARASGPGGQNVNKRETAVRVAHVPTGLSAHAASERTQERNREEALKILRGKLYRHQEAAAAAERAGFSLAKTAQVEWGSQIRSYVLHPYKMVKDHRTGVESHDPDKVLGGELDEFIEAEQNALLR